MATKDRRYSAIRSMIGVGELARFGEIFDIVPKTQVSKDLGMNYQTFTRKVAEPDLFSIRELQHMATLFDVTIEDLLSKVLADLSHSRKKGK